MKRLGWQSCCAVASNQPQELLPLYVNCNVCSLKWTGTLNVLQLFSSWGTDDSSNQGIWDERLPRRLKEVYDIRRRGKHQPSVHADRYNLLFWPCPLGFSWMLLPDNQIIDETMLENINCVLNSGEVPNLFPQDEMDHIVSDMLPKLKVSAAFYNTKQKATQYVSLHHVPQIGTRHPRNAR